MIILICARNEMWLFPGLNAVCILICGPKLETRLTPCGQKVVRFRIYRSNLRSQVKHSHFFIWFLTFGSKIKNSFCLFSDITFDRNFVKVINKNSRTAWSMDCFELVREICFLLEPGAMRFLNFILFVSRMDRLRFVDPWSWQGCQQLHHISVRNDLGKRSLCLICTWKWDVSKNLEVILKIETLKDLVFFGDNRLRG